VIKNPLLVLLILCNHQNGTLSAQERAVVPCHGGVVVSISFSPDWKSVYITVGDSFKVWDVSNFKEILTLKECRVARLAFSPDGKTLATTGSEGLERAIDTKNWKVMHRLGRGLAFSPYGKVLA
jgi:WD40 repeat protein